MYKSFLVFFIYSDIILLIIKERIGYMIEDILKYNEQFVKDKSYEKYITSKYPDKKIAILSCMDTRLTELIPAALGLKMEMLKL